MENLVDTILTCVLMGTRKQIGFPKCQIKSKFYFGELLEDLFPLAVELVFKLLEVLDQNTRIDFVVVMWWRRRN